MAGVPFQFARDFGATELKELEEFPPKHPFVIAVSKERSTYTGYEGQYGKCWERRVYVFETEQAWREATLALYREDPKRHDVWAFRASGALRPTVSLAVTEVP